MGIKRVDSGAESVGEGYAGEPEVAYEDLSSGVFAGLGVTG
jgi:hypothetical protein